MNAQQKQQQEGKRSKEYFTQKDIQRKFRQLKVLVEDARKKGWNNIADTWADEAVNVSALAKLDGKLVAYNIAEGTVSVKRSK